MSETCHIYSFIKKGFDLFLANVIIICDFYIKFVVFFEVGRNSSFIFFALAFRVGKKINVLFGRWLL
jgi:hypothetical protein